MGVALARPAEKVVAVLGDGSAMYAIQGSWSAAQLGLPITFAIIKNGRYEALDDFAHRFGLQRPVGIDLPELDFCGHRRAQGLFAIHVDRVADPRPGFCAGFHLAASDACRGGGRKLTGGLRPGSRRERNRIEGMTAAAGGRLAGKTCVITGGAGSIGLASARLFLAEGARVMLVDHDASALAEAAASLASANAATCVADVGDAGDVKAYVDATVAAFGRIDVLFSNAGNMGPIGPIADYPEDGFDAVYRVHVRGAFLACKYGIAQMNDGGSVIITSSVVGLRGDPGPYGYITAKHAQVGLMRSVAKEAAGRGIRVNTIHPGPTQNAFQAGVEEHLGKVLGRDAGEFFDEIIPLGRHAAPEEIARSVLYLASDDSSFVTGTTLSVDGGMSA